MVCYYVDGLDLAKNIEKCIFIGHIRILLSNFQSFEVTIDSDKKVLPTFTFRCYEVFGNSWHEVGKPAFLMSAIDEPEKVTTGLKWVEYAEYYVLYKAGVV